MTSDDILKQCAAILHCRMEDVVPRINGLVEGNAILRRQIDDLQNGIGKIVTYRDGRTFLVPDKDLYR